DGRGQIKTGTRPWCPIFPELQREMDTWEKQCESPHKRYCLANPGPIASAFGVDEVIVSSASEGRSWSGRRSHRPGLSGRGSRVDANAVHFTLLFFRYDATEAVQRLSR